METKCSFCEKHNEESSIEIINRPICKFCFTNQIEKRIRKNIRVNRFFSKNDDILIIMNNTNGSFTTKYIMEQVEQKMPIKLSFKDSFTSEDLSNFDIIIASQNTDDEIDTFINQISELNLINEIKNNDEIKKRNHIISVIDNVSEQECFLFNTFKELDTVKVTKHELDDFDKPYPETKFSTNKSIKKIKSIILK